MTDPTADVVRRLMAGDPDTLAEYADALTEQAVELLRPVLHCPDWCDRDHDEVLGWGVEHRRRVASFPAWSGGDVDRPAVEVYDRWQLECADDPQLTPVRPTAWLVGEGQLPLDVDLVRALADAVGCDLVPRTSLGAA